ncbi:hypothetical protein AB0L63_10270 [Nocardia sp. NPDC051990]|uniref:hypothetical protein n=1 Tax=Nocardia sp. NPDC051990 TaxID=3155285 RepID=UPI00341CD256
MPDSPDSPLPQRDPFVGPPGTYSGASADVVELFADAVRQWADVPTETSRCRGVESPGTGDHEQTEVVRHGTQ